MLWLGLSISVVLGALLTWAVRGIATKRRLLFKPVSLRHIHSRPIPRLGGVAVFLTFVIVYGLYCLATFKGFVQRPPSFDGLRVFVPATLLFATGLIDDLRGLSATTKLLVQIAGGICLSLSGLHLFCFYWPGLGPGLSSAICLATTVFWVVLICNAINLIDGLDGLAAGAALFSMVTITTVALLQGRTSVAMAIVILAGSLFGFLLFNFNPASIFLGDAGSLFVGFMLSGFVLAEAPKQSPIGAIAIPMMSLALPLLDTGLSVLRRFLSGHSLFGADREHIHHKLLELGLTQRQVVWILYGFSAVAVILSLALVRLSSFVAIPAITTLFLLLFFGLRKLPYREFREFQRIWKRALQQKRAIAQNIAVRKAAADLRNSHQVSTVLRLLQDCLQPEFEGFEICLNDRFAKTDTGQRLRTSQTERFWGSSIEETIIFIFELSAPKYGRIGRIALYRCNGAEWVTDVDLLTGEFRKSIGMALQNCLSRQPATLTLPVLNRKLESHAVVDTLE